MVVSIEDSYQVSAYNNTATNILPLQEIKDFLRIDTNYDDELIKSLIEIAFSIAEEYLQRDIIEKEYEVQIHNYVDLFNNKLFLNVFPVIEIKEMEYLLNGVMTDIPSTEYTLNKTHSSNTMGLNPSNLSLDVNGGGEVFAVLRVGTTPVALPPFVKHAIKMHVAFLYENRGDSLPELDIPIPQNILSMYKKYRIRKFV